MLRIDIEYSWCAHGNLSLIKITFNDLISPNNDTHNTNTTWINPDNDIDIAKYFCYTSLGTSSPFPVKNLSSQLTHCKLIWKLTASSFWSHSTTSQLTHETISPCDLAVSPPWVGIWHCDLAVTCSWDQPISSPCSGSSELTVILLLTSGWDIQVSPLWVWH